MSHSQQRSRPRRYSVSLLATLSLDESVTACTIKNLSLGGALLATSAALSMGRVVRVTFALRDLGEAVDAEAVVRWTEYEAVGVQFQGLRAREVWALGRFFSQL